MEPASYAAASARIGKATGVLLSSLWRSDGLWADKLNQAALIVTAGQIRAASLAITYTESHGASGDIGFVPAAFGGLASDGRPLSTLMAGASVAADRAGGGRFPLLKFPDLKSAREAQDAAAQAWLLMAARTQIADTGRAAVRSAMAAYDMSGVRVANLPCCGRCAILAGRVYHWSAGFQRHQNCDCTMAPKPGTQVIAEDQDIPLDQIRGLSKADRQAVEMGADLTRVVNAQRGMYTAEVYGKKVKATFDSTKHRDALFPARDNVRTVRLRPESILRHATDQQDAVRLLTKYGYIA